MNAKQITAIVVVVGLLAVGIVGAGYAYQAIYTDQISGTESTTGQFLKVNDATYSGTHAIKLEDTTSSTLYLNAGVDATKSNDTVTYKWDGSGAILSATSTGGAITTAYEVTEKAAQQTSLTVKVLYCLGAYNITAPVNATTATITASSCSATNTYYGTNVTAAVEANQHVYYLLTTAGDYTATDLAASSLSLTADGGTGDDHIGKIGTTATTVYLYALAIWTIGFPTGADAALTLTLDATTPVITATAESYGAA